MRFHLFVAALLAAGWAASTGLNSFAGRLLDSAAASAPAEADLRLEVARLESDIEDAGRKGDVELTRRLCRKLAGVVIQWREVVKASGG